MNWKTWDKIESILDHYTVAPIVALVPDNQDPKLRVDAPNPAYWQRAREWQSKGWVIGLHGYQHVYDSMASGLVPWWQQSEFAGHPYELQSFRIRQGRRHLEDERLHPTIWVAPAHSFDEVTLKVLSEEGVHHVSDGMGYRPIVDSHGFIWIPAQPWKPLPVKFGVWTMIYHHNKLRDTEEFEHFVRLHRSDIMGSAFSFHELIATARSKRPTDSAFEKIYWRAFSVRRGIRRRIRGR